MTLGKMSSKISLAYDFFQKLHAFQKRKDNVRPYFVHLEDVAARVSQVTSNEDIIIAALGHDSVEDVPGFSPLTLRAEFGRNVENLVVDLTDVYTKLNFPDLNRKARKQRERERYASISSQAKLIKLSDIASNLADDGEVLLADGGAEVGFNQMFIWEKSLCLPYLKDKGAENELLFSQAMEILREQAEKFKVKLK